MSEVDRLEVKVEAQARGANSQLDKLVQQLGSVKNALYGINGSGLIGISNGIGKLAVSMKSMQGVKTTDFTRLTRNIQSLGSINTQNINLAASAMSQITRAFNNMGTVSNNAAQVGELAKSISKLGNKSVVSAITNIPNLSKALVEMMRVLSGAPQVSKNVIDMTNAMASLSANGAKVASTSKNLSTGFKQYAESTRKAKESSKSLAYYIGKLYANYFLLIRATKWLGSAITSSMDYIEEYNYFNVTMEKVASEWSQDFEKYGYESAEAYGDSFQSRLTELMSKMTGFKMNSDGTLTDLMSNNLGLDVTTLANYSAGLMQVTNSLGLTGEASESTSKALSMLAGDMSSFRNLDLNSVMTNFQSGLIGQSRALYKYGIDITNATLANYALQLGLSKSVSEMTQGEKMQLRMIAILDQSKVAWGDLANTINSPSNQLRMFKNNMTALSRTIGNIFLPVVAKVLPYINGLTLAVRRLFTWIGSLLGVDLSGIIGSSSAGYSDAFSDLADDAEDTRSSIDGVSDSANKLKNSLLGFDEINALSSPDTSSNGGGTGSATGGNALDLTDQLNAALADYESVWNASFDSMENTANKYADDIVGFFQGIAKYAEPSVDAVKRLWDDGLSKFKDFKTQELKDFYNDFLSPLGKWALGTGLPRFFDVTNDLFTNINWKKLNSSLDDLFKAMSQFGEVVFDGALDFYECFMVPIGKWTFNDAVPKLADTISKFAKSVSWKSLNSSLEDFWKALSRFGTKVGDGLLAFFDGMAKIGSVTIGALAICIEAFAQALDLIPTPILKIAGAEIGAVVTAFLAFKTASSISGIITSIGSAFETLMIVIMCHPVAAAITLAAGLAVALFDIFSQGDDAKEQANNISDAVKTVVDSSANARQSFEDTRVSTEGNYGAIRDIVDEYYNLAKRYDTLSESDKNLMETYKTMINDTCPDLIKIMDDGTLSFEEQEGQVYKTIDALEKYAINAAMSDVLKELYTEQAKVNISLKKNRSEYQRAEDTVYTYLASISGLTVEEEKAAYGGIKLSDVLKGTNQKLGGVVESTGWTVDAVKRLENENSALQTSQNDTNTTIDATKDYLNEMNMKYAESSAAANQTATDVESSGQRISNSASATSIKILETTGRTISYIDTETGKLGTIGASGANAYSDGYKRMLSSSNLPSYMSGILSNIKGISESYGSGGGSSFISGFISSIRSSAGNIKNAIAETISSNIEIGLTTGKHSAGSPMLSGFSQLQIKAHANGGFPEQGQYFLARESGPELVGTIGGKSAVANNSQIVESVAFGVKQAVMEAMFMMGSGSSGDTVIHSHLYIDGEQVAESVNRANENKDGRYNPVSSIG